MKETKKLFNTGYGKNFQNHLLEQYKLYVNSAEEVSRRRESANNFYLSINTAVFSISGYLSFKSFESWTIILAILGIIICYVWSKAIKSYRQLNSSKFNVILKLEEKMPAKLFDYEWDLLGKGSNNKYSKLTIVENKVPLIFVLLYVLAIFLVILF